MRELSNNVGKAQLVGGLLPPDRYRDRKSSLFLLNQFSRAQNTKSDWESQIPIGFGMKYEQARNYTGRSLFVKCDMKQCMNEYDGEKWD